MSGTGRGRDIFGRVKWGTYVGRGRRRLNGLVAHFLHLLRHVPCINLGQSVENKLIAGSEELGTRELEIDREETFL
jgi:hypothetical protein